jgi:hypothetical protein
VYFQWLTPYSIKHEACVHDGFHYIQMISTTNIYVYVYVFLWCVHVHMLKFCSLLSYYNRFGGFIEIRMEFLDKL